jgi:cytochrome o ubiquinol oxidase subunit 2
VNRKVKTIIALLVIVGVIATAVVYFRGVNVSVLNPQGQIADQQRNLIVFTSLLSLVVIVPVFGLLAFIAWKYREGNTKAKYTPDWDGNKFLETIWWGIPCAIILTLSIVTWNTSHALDPYKPLTSNVTPIQIQVVALQWKWLFIYPDQHVASVGLFQIPEKTPINLSITSDAPMNSFWLPSLGGQIYAMSGMSTQLHLLADKTGDYQGSSANISGQGFADMTFTARSTNQAGFNAWIQATQRSQNSLDWARYTALAKPSTSKTPSYYSLKDDALYDKIVMKYMAPLPTTQTKAPASNNSNMTNMSGMKGM